MLIRAPAVRIQCRYAGQACHMGLPAQPGLGWGGPVVVVLSPLIVRESWLAFLDMKELESLAAVRHSEIRSAKLAAHALLRLVLARVDGAPPNEHSLQRDARGRPQPRRLLGWSCSLSHDPLGVAVAVGAGNDLSDRLGVDICRPLADRSGLLCYLNEAERLLISENPEASDRLLARCWASKEALLKRWGWGMIPGLDRICTVPGPSHDLSFRAPRDAQPASSSIITSLLLDDGPAIALAHRPDQVPTWWRVSAAELDAALLGP
jgi:phosphopantetheinyl transferase